MSALKLKPTVSGKSKRLLVVDQNTCLIQLLPSLRSYTYNRDEVVKGTEILRLDFYELASRVLSRGGLKTAFRRRVGIDTYIADYCQSPPFETIVKNVAIGSTQLKYPGLFKDGHRFDPPVVKFDYRIDPEDQPISDDYVSAAGFNPNDLKNIALKANNLLSQWLRPNDLLDFCLVIGQTQKGQYVILSEISPDCMRLRAPDGQSLDKDLFRRGATHHEICRVWRRLIDSL